MSGWYDLKSSAALAPLQLGGEPWAEEVLICHSSFDLNGTAFLSRSRDYPLRPPLHKQWLHS
jgi:hypothetical protein